MEAGTPRIVHPYFSYQVLRRPMRGLPGWLRLAWHYGVRVWDPRDPARFDRIVELQRKEGIRWVSRETFRGAATSVQTVGAEIPGDGRESADAGVRLESFFELGRGVINRVDFCFLQRNCEHFATWIACNRWHSSQLEKWFQQRLGRFQPGTDQNHPYHRPPI